MSSDKQQDAEPTRKLYAPSTKIFNEIVEELTGKSSRKNAVLGPYLISRAITLTSFSDSREATFKRQIMIAGAIMIQVFDHKTEAKEQFATGVLHKQVIIQLIRKGFDAQVVERVRTHGLKKLEEMRSAMDNEQTAYIDLSADYENIATLSNGAQYIAALFQDYETETPKYVYDVNCALRKLLDLASVKKDFLNGTPNVLLRRLKQTPNESATSIAGQIQAEITEVIHSLSSEIETDSADKLKVYYYNLLITAQQLFQNPVVRLYVKKQLKSVTTSP